MTTIFLARHGETDWNRERRWQGWADPPLNETGREQSRALARELLEAPFDAVYASDLRRAHETAEIVAAPHGVPVVADERLREIDVGSWSGLTHAEVEQRFPDGRRSDGETGEQHAERVHAAVAAIAHEHAGRRILIVTHGGSIRALLGGASDVPSAWVQNCGVIELEFKDGRLVEPARSTG